MTGVEIFLVSIPNCILDLFLRTLIFCDRRASLLTYFTQDFLNFVPTEENILSMYSTLPGVISPRDPTSIQVRAQANIIHNVGDMAGQGISPDYVRELW